MTSFQSSGLSIKKWCRENHIAPPAFYYCNNPEVIDTLLPWSKELPDICHLSYNRKITKSTLGGIFYVQKET